MDAGCRTDLGLGAVALAFRAPAFLRVYLESGRGMHSETSTLEYQEPRCNTQSYESSSRYCSG